MKKYLSKPHIIIFLLALIFWIFGLIFRESVIDINIHDTFYVIGFSHITTLIALILGIMSLVFWVLNKRL